MNKHIALALLSLGAALFTGCDNWLPAFDTYHGLTMVSTNPDFTCDSASPAFSLINASGEILYRGAYVVPGALKLQFRDVDRYHTGGWIGGWHNAGEIAMVTSDCSKRQGAGYVYAHAEAAVDWMGGRSATINLVLHKVAMPMMPMMPADTDGDGIPNDMDNCPNETGVPENYGCPAVTPPAPPPVLGTPCDGIGSSPVDYAGYVCWFAPGQNVPVNGLSAAKGIWTKSDALLPVVTLTDVKQSTDARVSDKDGNVVVTIVNMSAQNWYAFPLAGVKIDSLIDGLGFNVLRRDMNYKLFSDPCDAANPTSQTCTP